MSVFSHIKFAARSDVGRKRKNNEDSYGPFPDAGVFCVADGMGGGDDGEIASAAVVDAVDAFVQSHKPSRNAAYSGDAIASGVSASICGASAWIFDRAQERNLKGCGSTFAGVCFDATAPAEAIALHVGDSRVYRIRGTSIRQITKDHSAAEMIGAKDEKSVNPCFRGVILRAVGVHSSVEVERTRLSLRSGDRIVICSDGLSKMVEDRELAAIVSSSESPDAAADALVAAANDAGGSDNITMIVLFVGKLPLACPAVAMAQERKTDDFESDDMGESDTSDTGMHDASEPDTANDSQTLGTMTCTCPNVPFRSPAHSPRIQIVDAPTPKTVRWPFFVCAVAVSVVLSAVISVLVYVHFLRKDEANGRPNEAERRDVDMNENRLGSLETYAATAVVAMATVERAEPKSTSDGKSAAVREKPNRKSPEELPIALSDVVQTTSAVHIVENGKAPNAARSVPDVLSRLAEACSPSNSAAFVKTARRFPNNGAVEALMMRFNPICDKSLPVERRQTIASAITADVQDIARELRKYSGKRIAHIDAALSDHMTHSEFKEKLTEERKGLAAFSEATEKFVDADPATAEAQLSCADVIIGVADWFRHIK